MNCRPAVLLLVVPRDVVAAATVIPASCQSPTQLGRALVIRITLSPSTQAAPRSGEVIRKNEGLGDENNCMTCLPPTVSSHARPRNHRTGAGTALRSRRTGARPPQQGGRAAFCLAALILAVGPTLLLAAVRSYHAQSFGFIGKVIPEEALWSSQQLRVATFAGSLAGASQLSWPFGLLRETRPPAARGRRSSRSRSRR